MTSFNAIGQRPYNTSQNPSNRPDSDTGSGGGTTGSAGASGSSSRSASGSSNGGASGSSNGGATSSGTSGTSSTTWQSAVSSVTRAALGGAAAGLWKTYTMPATGGSMDPNLQQVAQSGERQLEQSLLASLPSGTSSHDLESAGQHINDLQAQSGGDNQKFMQSLVDDAVKNAKDMTKAGTIQADADTGILGQMTQAFALQGQKALEGYAVAGLTTIMNSAGAGNLASLAGDSRRLGAAASYVQNAAIGAVAAGAVQAGRLGVAALATTFQQAFTSADRPGSDVYQQEIAPHAQGSQEPQSGKTSDWTRSRRLGPDFQAQQPSNGHDELKK